MINILHRKLKQPTVIRRVKNNLIAEDTMPFYYQSKINKELPRPCQNFQRNQCNGAGSRTPMVGFFTL